MDSLSQLIATLSPRGRMELRCLFGAAWAAPHEAAGRWHAPFHVLLRGAAELHLPREGRTIALRPGTLVVLPRGAPHTLRAVGTSRRRAAVRTVAGEAWNLKTNVADPDDAETEILCGEFEFRSRRRSALLDALPEAFAIEFAERAEFGWLQGLVRMMAHEIAQAQPGAAAVVDELSGALFALAVRAHLETHPQPGGVLGLMRHARLAPALAAMLQAPQQAWTVAALADRCHLSRASFARLFKTHAGSGPLELLTTLRMEAAARLLVAGAHDTATVGEAVGYRSEAAFNRAFARHAGTTPGRYRRGTLEQPSAPAPPCLSRQSDA